MKIDSATLVLIFDFKMSLCWHGDPIVYIKEQALKPNYFKLTTINRQSDFL